MDETKENPSDINSLRVLNVLRTSKKRKFHAEQLGLPIPKHKSWERATASDGPVSIFYGTRKSGCVDRLTSAKGKMKGLAIDNVSELESMKDSNSYTEDTDSSASIFSDAKNRKTSDVTLSSSSDDSAMIKAVCSEEEIADPQAFLNLQEQLLEFGNHAEFIDSEYEDKSLDQCSGKELEDFLYSNGLSSNVYVLSSGRWSVNQEVQSGSRKPTIDQEFEQYFSTLML